MVSVASKSALSTVSAPVFHDKQDVRETSEVRPCFLYQYGIGDAATTANMRNLPQDE
jgi:hypothetical protein